MQALSADASPTPSTNASALTAAEALSVELAKARGEDVVVYESGEEQLVRGLENEELFVLQRRFNKASSPALLSGTQLTHFEPSR